MRLATSALALAVGLLAAGPVSAQPPAGGGGFNMFFPTVADLIARNKALQDELKMDAAQVEKLTLALTQAREDGRELSQKLFGRDASPEERNKVFQQMREINDKALAGALKPEQVKRLKQLDNQMLGLVMFSKPEVAAALKLTDEQRRQIVDIASKLNTDRRGLLGGAGRGAGRPDPEVTKKLADLQKGAMAGAVKLLTDEQKATFKDLVGEPFEMPGAAGLLGFGGFAGLGGPGGGAAPVARPGGFGAPPGGPPGTILSAAAQEQLKLTADQKKEVDVLQKEVDARLSRLLTAEQRKQLQDLRDRRPGGFGPPRKD